MTTVNDQLKLLISLYEEEKIQLQKLIDDCLVETEYLMAHYHLIALYQLNSKLRNLNNLDDKFYDEKNFKRNRISGLEKRIEGENSDYKNEYHLKELQRAKEELEKLNQIPKQEPLPCNTTLLDDTFKKLIEKEIKNLKLILEKNDNLFLTFSYSKKVLKVTLPYVKKHKKKEILYDTHINAFKKLGFELTGNETKLTLRITGDKEKILDKLKILLLKIFFETFHFKYFENKSYIQFTEKVRR